MKRLFTLIVAAIALLSGVGLDAQNQNIQRKRRNIKRHTTITDPAPQHGTKQPATMSPDDIKKLIEIQKQKVNEQDAESEEQNDSDLIDPTDDRAFEEAYEAWSDKNFSFSFPIFQRLADNGYVKAYGYMGLSYEFGEGVEKNEFTAIQWYSKAVEAGDLMWNYRIGNLYYQRKAYDLALTPLTSVAEMTNGGGWFPSAAAYMVGHIYEEGLAGEKNIDKAIKYYKIAADKGEDRGTKALERLNR